MAGTSSELLWICYLLHDLHLPHPQPAALYCDNQMALYIAANPICHERTKHIEVDCHLVRDQIQAGLLHTCHVRTNAQLADIFTNALSSSHFYSHLSKPGI